MEDKKALVDFVQRLVNLSKELPSGSKKPERGGRAVIQAPIDSAIVTKFTEEVDKYKTIDAAAAQKILESIRKKDDQLLKKVKISKGEEIHHMIGYAEFARATQNMSLADTLDAMLYLADEGIELGTSPGNLKHSALQKSAHRPTRAESAGVDAHLGTGGRTIKWNPDVPVPTDLASFKNAWETSIYPQAVAGQAMGMIADSDRKSLMIQQLIDNEDIVTNTAKKYGLNAQELMAGVASRGLDIENFKPDKLTKAIQEAYKQLPDIGTSVPAQRDTNTVTTFLDEVGFKGRELLRIARDTPEAITKNNVFTKQNLTGITDQLSKLLIEANSNQRIKQLSDTVQMVNNPAGRRSLALAPVIGPLVGGLSVEANQRQREEEIAANPNDPTLKINKHLDWWSGQADRVTLAGAGLTATGYGAPLGIPMMVAGEAASLATGAPSLAIDAGRAGVKWWNNTKEKAEEIKQEQSTAKQLSVGFAGAM